MGETINAHGDWDGCSEVMQFDAIIKYNTAMGAPQQDVARIGDGGRGAHTHGILSPPNARCFQQQHDFEVQVWTGLIVPVSDMKGIEQNVWSRFQQVECSG